MKKIFKEFKQTAKKKNMKKYKTQEKKFEA